MSLIITKDPSQEYYFQGSRDVAQVYVMPDNAGEIKIGEGTKIGHGVVLEAGTVIGSGCFIGHHTILRPGVTIGDNTLIGHLTVFEGNNIVGDNVVVHSQCHITRGVIIEDKVFIAPLVVAANDMQMTHQRHDVLDYEECPPIFKYGCRVGVSSVILPGIIIGKNSLVASAAVVTKDVPEAKKVRGAPAFIFGDVPEKEWL